MQNWHLKSRQVYELIGGGAGSKSHCVRWGIRPFEIVMSKTTVYFYVCVILVGSKQDNTQTPSLRINDSLAYQIHKTYCRWASCTVCLIRTFPELDFSVVFSDLNLEHLKADDVSWQSTETLPSTASDTNQQHVATRLSNDTDYTGHCRERNTGNSQIRSNMSFVARNCY